MKRAITLTTMAAGLGACATTGADLMERAPNATFHTDKPAEEVVRCLTSANRNYGNPMVVTDQTGTTMTFVDHAGTTMAWAISPDGTVRVWRLHGLVRFRGAAETCL
jgi:hypothetical protein